MASNRPTIPATCSATGSSKLSAQSPPWSRKPRPSASSAIASRSRAASSIAMTGAAPASRASTASQQRFVGIGRHLAGRMAAPAGGIPAAVRNKRRTHGRRPSASLAACQSGRSAFSRGGGCHGNQRRQGRDRAGGEALVSPSLRPGARRDHAWACWSAISGRRPAKR